MRRETAFSPSRRRELQKLDLTEVLSALLRVEEQIVGGVLELADYWAAGDAQASSPQSVAGF